MDQSGTFARHFARLVSLLLYDAGNVVEQKMSLRALVTVSRGGAVTLVVLGHRLYANDAPVPPALAGVRDVAERLASHSVAELRIAQATSAAELLALARAVGEPGQRGDDGARLLARIQAAGAQSITIVAQGGASAAPPVPEMPVVPEPERPAVPPSPASDAPQAAAEAAALISRLIASDMSQRSPADVLSALDVATSIAQATKLLDDVVLLAERAQRSGRTAVVGDILHGLVARERNRADPEVTRAVGLTIRRLARPPMLRAVAALIPGRPQGKQFYYEVLERVGEDGAEATIAQIMQAATTSDRAALLDVLRELKHGVPALRRMLGDSRWFVVRDAAELLGELNAAAAESDLAGLLRHADDRVRRAATNALLRLGTPDAVKNVYEAVNDESPEVRMHTAAALAARRDARTSGTLIRAIEGEDDGDVQLAMIAALGKVATPDAVQKLVRLAQPEGRLFRRKAMPVRVAAIQALGEARTPAALAALRGLQEDKEREVRDTASRALAHVSR